MGTALGEENTRETHARLEHTRARLEQEMAPGDYVCKSEVLARAVSEESGETTVARTAAISEALRGARSAVGKLLETLDGPTKPGALLSRLKRAENRADYWEKRIDGAHELITTLRSVLRELEWIRDAHDEGEDGWDDHFCPSCGGIPVSESGDGHEHGCRLAAALGITMPAP